MYSKEEAKVYRKNFWDAFDQYSKQRRRKLRKNRNWILHNTGIKGIRLKFDVDQKSAQVAIEIASKGLHRQIKYFEKMQGLEALLNKEFNNQLIWNDHYLLDSGKEVFRIYIEKNNVNIFKESDWETIFAFLFTQMNKLEDWFIEYKDIIKMNEEEIFNDQ